MAQTLLFAAIAGGALLVGRRARLVLDAAAAAPRSDARLRRWGARRRRHVRSFGGAAAIRAAGSSAGYAFSIWAATAALLALGLVAGRLAAGVAPMSVLGLLAAFAAGAVLASIAGSVMPEAYREGGPLVAFATTAGFLAAYALTTLD
jgi:hypothetical protein